MHNSLSRFSILCIHPRNIFSFLSEGRGKPIPFSISFSCIIIKNCVFKGEENEQCQEIQNGCRIEFCWSVWFRGCDTREQFTGNSGRWKQSIRDQFTCKKPKSGFGLYTTVCERNSRTTIHIGFRHHIINCQCGGFEYSEQHICNHQYVWSNSNDRIA